jgi:hypothetical protein
METVRQGDDLCTCCLNASTRSKCPAMTDLEDCKRLLQATAGVLSQKIPTVEYCNDSGAICSMTSQAISTPAISRSELVTEPFGFDVDIMLDVISAGHCFLNTVGGMYLVPLSHTPPTPEPEAST